ncbi:MAG: 50S ribosome-binding GTPase, partial [bacterium]|nr:50S ribosome-binding GTPase [bacterium]
MALRTPVLAIVGRPNVGKSTLFNRILGQRKAVVEDIPGVTRDRNYALVDRGYDFPFYLIDTGGFEETPEDELGASTVLQTKLAIEEADLVIGVFDGNLGLQVGDKDIVNLLRSSKKIVAYVVNKCDGIEMQDKIIDFYSLGVGDLVGLSALHGVNVRLTVDRLLRLLPDYERLKQSHISKKQNEELRLAELRQEIVDDEDNSDFADEMPERRAVYDIDIDLENLDAEKEEEEDTWEPMPVFSPDEGTIEDYLRAYRLQGKTRKEFFSDISEIDDEKEVVEEVEEIEEEEVLPEIECIKVAIIGRPNVGKSTLLNTITGETRSITSEVAGTTRDVVDVTITRNGQKFIILDTAGLRKKARVGQTVERYSVIRALRALEDADVAVVVIDGTTGVTEQDAKIVGLAHEL